VAVIFNALMITAPSIDPMNPPAFPVDVITAYIVPILKYRYPP